MGVAKRSPLVKRKYSRLYLRKPDEAISHFQALLDLPTVIFMSLGFEGRGNIGNSRIDEIGICILDTRQMTDNSNLLSSRHVTTRHKGKNFLFGQSERVSSRKAPAFIQNLFYIEDIGRSADPPLDKIAGKNHSDPSTVENGDTPRRTFRKIVFLGYGVQGDASMLTEFGINLQNILPIVDIIDVEVITRAVFGKPFSLGALLECLGVLKSNFITPATTQHSP